jgi:hypothetical protein
MCLPLQSGLAPVVDHAEVWRYRTLTIWRAERERERGEEMSGGARGYLNSFVLS